MLVYHTKEVMHFRHVELLVKDLKHSLEFYQQILRLTILEQSNEKAVLSANQKTPLITLVENKNALSNVHTLGLYHYAILLSSRSALAHVIKQLIDYRYNITGASDHGVSEAVYLNDPDGNGIEIYHDRATSDWPKTNGQIEMYTQPMDLNAVMATLPDVPYASFDKEAVMGHLHFHVGNLEQAKKHYIDLFGFKRVLDYGGAATFMSDKAYHHHLGVNTWQPNKRLRQGNETGLIGYTLFVPMDKLAHFIKHLQQGGIEVIKENNQYIFYDILKQKVLIESS